MELDFVNAHGMGHLDSAEHGERENSDLFR
jgi:hypothetical protein